MRKLNISQEAKERYEEYYKEHENDGVSTQHPYSVSQEYGSTISKEDALALDEPEESLEAILDEYNRYVQEKLVPLRRIGRQDGPEWEEMLKGLNEIARRRDIKVCHILNIIAKL